MISKVSAVRIELNVSIEELATITAALATTNQERIDRACSIYGVKKEHIPSISKICGLSNQLQATYKEVEKL